MMLTNWCFFLGICFYPIDNIDWSNSTKLNYDGQQLFVGIETKMKLLVLIFIIIASKAIDAEYKSVKVTRNEHVVGSNIHTGTFITKLDHFRPQDPRTVEMVSFSEQ